MIHSALQALGLAALGVGLWLVFGWGIALIVLGVLVVVGSVLIEYLTSRPAAPLPELKDGD
jgi:hypothetical protein